MKKLFVLLVFTAIGYVSNAQEIGIRGGDVVGGDVAIDALFSTGKFNKIHADISFGNGVGIEALWDIVYRPLGGEALNWYLGFGPSMRIADDFLFGVSGEAGLAYNFRNIPLSISADYRPTLEIVENTGFNWGGWGFNLRYVFGAKR